jgi:hypothetical protein
LPLATKKLWAALQTGTYMLSSLVLCLGVLCGTLQREILADFGKMVPDLKKVVPGLVTKHTAFLNRNVMEISFAFIVKSLVLL